MEDEILLVSSFREYVVGENISRKVRLLLLERANKLRVFALRIIKLNIRMVPCFYALLRLPSF